MACNVTKICAHVPEYPIVPLHSVGKYKYIGIRITAHIELRTKSHHVQSQFRNGSFPLRARGRTIVTKLTICIIEPWMTNQNWASSTPPGLPSESCHALNAGIVDSMTPNKMA